MNKVMKIVSVLVMVVMMATMLSTVCMAKDIDVTDIENYGEGVKTEEIKKIGGTILKTVRNIAAILMVVLIAILGIKFMMGSTEEKAEYKKSFIPLIVGVALVLAASTIGGIIWNTFNSL